MLNNKKVKKYKNINILGLNLLHDSSASIIKNGVLVSACEQERFNKKKHTNEFPLEAIKESLKISKLSLNQINEINVSFSPSRYIEEFLIKPTITDKRKMNFLFGPIKKNLYIHNLEKTIREKLNYKKKINFLNHHVCHLASAYYPSNFKDSLVVSIDGLGEVDTTMFAVAKDNKIKVLDKETVRFPNSLGLIYAAFTKFLGWKPFYDEGIVMGLASLGNSKNKIPNTNITYRNLLKKIIIYSSCTNYKINSDWITFHYQRDTWFSDKFFKVVGKMRKYNSSIKRHHKDLAAALQERVEEVFISILKNLKKRTKKKNLCLAGGVALNCSMNGKIYNSNLFEKIFVQPASGDSGTAIGAAIIGYQKFFPKKKITFKNFYLGKKFNDRHVKKILNKNSKKIYFKYCKDIYSDTSVILSKSKIVAWFQGGAEFGPRALGNRSILSKPFPKKIKDHINKNVKFRESFRPFAPAVIDNKKDVYFNLNQSSPHMLLACKVNKKYKNFLSAVSHVDSSARVQTVSSDTNLKFFKLLKAFEKLNSIPVL